MAEGAAELDIGGPQVLTYEEIARRAAHAARPCRITHLPAGLVRGTAAVTRRTTPQRIWGPLQFFATIMTMDMVAPPHGTDTLADFFAARQATPIPHNGGLLANPARTDLATFPEDEMIKPRSVLHTAFTWWLRHRSLVRAPIWLFRARLGFVFGSRLLMIEHTGRKTGARRYVTVEVSAVPEPGPASSPPFPGPSNTGTSRPTPGSASPLAPVTAQPLPADVQMVGDSGGKAPQWAERFIGAEKLARVLAAMGCRSSGSAVWRSRMK